MLQIIDIPDRIHIPQTLSRPERLKLRAARRRLMAIWTAPTHDHKAEADTLAEIRRLLRI
jgi:hypothetical protein